MDSRNTEHKPPTEISHDRKVLRRLPIASLHEERLQLLQRCVHRDDLIRVRLPPELDHRRRHWVRILHRPLLYQLAQAWYAQVAQQRAGVLRDDSKVRVVPLERREERIGDRVGGVAGERGGWVEVLDGGLGDQLDVIRFGGHRGRYSRRGTCQTIWSGTATQPPRCGLL